MIEMLQASLFTSAETLINQLLKRDPVTLKHLESLTGKVVQLECTSPRLNIYLLPNADGLQIQSVYHDQPDVILTGEATDFLTLLTTKTKTDVMFGKTISIAGDSALATRFQEIMQDTQIDWEAMLGDVIGDLPAHQIANFISWKAQFYKNTGQSLLNNFDEYVKEEVRLVPTRPEAEKFYQDIQELKEKTERLGAQAAQLLNK